jgi:hypothetical protein
MGTEKELLELKEKIKNAELQYFKLEGQLEVIKNQLLNEWGCQSIEDAEKLAEEFKASIEELSNLIFNEYSRILSKLQLSSPLSEDASGEES